MATAKSVDDGDCSHRDLQPYNEDVYLGDEEESGFEAISGNLFKTEGNLTSSIFAVCDEDKVGKVRVSLIMDYIKHQLLHGDYNNSEDLTKLWKMFDADCADVLVDQDTYQSVMNDWIQEMQLKNWSPDDNSFVHLSSKRSSTDQILFSPSTSKRSSSSPHRLYSPGNCFERDSLSGSADCTFGSIEGHGGDQSLADALELSKEVNELRHRLQLVLEQKAKAEKLAILMEDRYIALFKDRKETEQQIESIQNALDKSRILRVEFDEMRECLIRSQESCRFAECKYSSQEKNMIQLQSKLKDVDDDLKSALALLEEKSSCLENAYQTINENKVSFEHHCELLKIANAKSESLLKEKEELEQSLTEARLQVLALQQETTELMKQTSSMGEEPVSRGERRLFLFHSGSSSKREPFELLDSSDQILSHRSAVSHLKEEQNLTNALATSVYTGKTLTPSLHMEMKHMVTDLPSPMCGKRSPEYGSAADTPGFCQATLAQSLAKNGVLRRLSKSHSRVFSRKKWLSNKKTKSSAALSSGFRICRGDVCSHIITSLNKRVCELQNLMFSYAERLSSDVQNIYKMCATLLASWEHDVLTSIPDGMLSVLDEKPPAGHGEGNHTTLAGVVEEPHTIPSNRKGTFLPLDCGELAEDKLMREMESIRQQLLKSQDILSILVRAASTSSSSYGFLHKDAPSTRVFNQQLHESSSSENLADVLNIDFYNEQRSSGDLLQIRMPNQQRKLSALPEEDHQDESSRKKRPDHPPPYRPPPPCQSTNSLSERSTQLEDTSVRKRHGLSGSAIRRSSAFEEDEPDALPCSSSAPATARRRSLLTATSCRRQNPSSSMMLEIETSETESAKGSMESEPELTSDGMPQLMARDGPFPSLPDSFLENLELHYNRESWLRIKNVDLSEQEIENKFQSLSLAFKNDKLTVGRRLELHQRQRDIAENNIEKELQSLYDRLQTSRQSLSDFEVDTFLQQVAALRSIYTRLASRAEVYGAVQQEKRLAQAVETMISHVENVVKQRVNLESQLEEARRMLLDACLDRSTRSAGTSPKVLDEEDGSDSIQGSSSGVAPVQVGSRCPHCPRPLMISSSSRTVSAFHTPENHRQRKRWGRPDFRCCILFFLCCVFAGLVFYNASSETSSVQFYYSLEELLRPFVTVRRYGPPPI